jgi:hypothetical protein
MMTFPEVYSGEMMWDIMKSAVLKAGEEQGYTLSGTKCDKSTVIVTNIGVYYELPCDCTLQNYNNGYIEKKYGKMFCETFISYLARTCSKIVVFMTSHGDIEVYEEGFMTMMFEAGRLTLQMMIWVVNGSLRVLVMTWIHVRQDRS